VEILLLHPGGLGDVILSLPAIGLLRNSFPSARLTIAGNIDHLAPIVSGYAERVLSLSTLPLHHLYAGGELPQADLRFWKSFDRIVSWTGSGHSEFVAKLNEVHGSACIAPWRPEPDERRHVARLFADSLDLSVPPEEGLTPARILLDSATRKEGGRWLAGHGWNGREPLAALHPGAGSQAKRWPPARFVALTRQLIVQERRKVLIIEGPAEPGLAQQVAQELPAPEVIRVEMVALDLLAPILERCSIFVGNDSGLAHLAAALQVPSVVLFGPTLPQHWAPLGPNVAVLRHADQCAACTRSRGPHTCLEHIQVEEVMQRIGMESAAPRSFVHIAPGR
jgi:hypothetical protein